jgi:hypothetical protein
MSTSKAPKTLKQNPNNLNDIYDSIISHANSNSIPINDDSNNVDDVHPTNENSNENNNDKNLVDNVERLIENEEKIVEDEKIVEKKETFVVSIYSFIVFIIYSIYSKIKLTFYKQPMVKISREKLYNNMKKNKEAYNEILGNHIPNFLLNNYGKLSYLTFTDIIDSIDETIIPTVSVADKNNPNILNICNDFITKK